MVDCQNKSHKQIYGMWAGGLSKQYAVTVRLKLVPVGKAKVVNHPTFAPKGPFSIGIVFAPIPPL